MPKYIDQLGSFENFEFSSVLTAEEIDREKLKKYVFGLLTDKAKAQDARDVAKAETAEVQTELDTANAELSSKAPADLQKKLQKAESERDDWKSKFEGLELGNLAIQVAKDKGLSDTQAKYLKGTTKDELEASADEFIKDNNITPKGDEDEDQDDEGNPLYRTPRSTINPGDPNPRAGAEKVVDIEAVVAGFESSPFR